MIRLLPFILIIILILGGLGYWRFIYSKSNTNELETAQQNSSDSPVEVPKTLPAASLEDRVRVLEDAVVKLTPKTGNLPAADIQTGNLSSVESRLTGLESAMTDLKTRVAILEKAAPASSVSNSKYPLYIPLGASGGPWTNTDWNSLNEYQISIDPDNYTGYTGMILEVNFRLVDPTGTGSIRLYNTTDSKVISSEISTSATSFSVYSTSSFKLSSGTKTYKLQVKSAQGKEIYIQTARIKVSF